MKWAWGMALAVFAALPAYADDACRPTPIASAPIEMDIAGRPLIPVQINGRRHKFLIDTGAIDTMLAHGAAQALGLPRESVASNMYVFVNGDTAVSRATARSFSVGGLSVGAFTFLVTPPTVHLPGASGALGPDVMRRFDIELDFGRNRFNIFPSGACGGGPVYWTDDSYAELLFSLDDTGHIEASAMLDGRIVDVLIDTGAVATSMTAQDAKGEFGIQAGLHGLSTVAERPDDLFSHTFSSLDLQGVSIQRPTIVIRPDRTGLRAAGLRPELVLGMTELSKLHLYIAYGERKIYITAAEDR